MFMRSVYEIKWIKKVSCKTQQQITDKRALTSDGLVMMECNIVSAPGVLIMNVCFDGT